MANKKNFITCDGNYAASYIGYMFSEVAAIYPITPSSNMAENIDEWAAAGKENMFGETVLVSELQSEGGASGAVHGSLQAGALTSTYTASQGLLLMIPNMYKISGELLPAVFHVSARSLASQALSIFGDHSDVMAARNTGFAMLATGSVQQIMDIAGLAHIAAIKSRIPFLHFFDGFRTSHEVQKIEALSIEDLKQFVDFEALQKFRDNSLNPDNPVTRGTAQNPDIYFQAREAISKFYDPIPDMIEELMQEITKMTGRPYHIFNYFGAEDAENIIIAMGSVTQTIKEVVEYMNQNGEKVGVIVVHLYRPFSEKHLMQALPKTVKKIAVLDRTKEPGANGEPLYLDIRDIFYNKENAPIIVGGRYGLSSKDTVSSDIVSVYNNLKLDNPKNHFTISIVDDVKMSSLPILPDVITVPEGTFEAKFYGLGSDGTVGANKNSIKIIGDSTDKYVQAYFAYDSKKSGGITTSHLRFGNKIIRSTYLVNNPDFVACHVPAYIYKYDMLKGMKENGVFLLNSIWDIEETKDRLPVHMKKFMAEKNISFYIINATKIASEIGLGERTNTIMQSAFFKVSNVISYESAVAEMKGAIEKSYGLKGEHIVKMNYAAVDKGGDVVKIEIPEDWKNLEDKEEIDKRNIPDFIRNIMEPINSLKGDSLPVSAFNGREDGTFPAGTTQYEKRGIAVNVPEWISENCIQCNQCAYVCPHAVIRPFLLTDEELKNAPENTETLKGMGATKEYQFRIQVSVLDCTGCNNCVEVCPGNKKGKALEMKPLGTQDSEIERWEYMHHKVGYKDEVVPKEKNVKNSQFAQPLFEFSGACAGCGETPYVKTITQLYGDRMTIANATGCSSIYGGSAPSTPYCTNSKGQGPAWANSLFEDNAEYGYGMSLASDKLRERIEMKMKKALNNGISEELKEAFTSWIENKNNAANSKLASAQVVSILENENSTISKEILALKQYLVKRSTWIFGGDGWAYDIGYGGLDHVLASGADVNILVLDTEVYSNTGGQASKSTPVGAVAKFAASGKKIRKKDLGMMAISYGYVYVTQIAMGANQNQCLKAIKEAEAYPGPSLIIAYSPCIAHGLKGGMTRTQSEEKRAVEAGYWTNYRYNPEMEKEGKNPFILDSKPPNWSKFQDFLAGEVRYTSLQKAFPKEAEELFKAAEENAKFRHKNYERFSKMDFSE
ncbi:MAG: pyruvate:ferredoxin (flavodoxin) oxidoreductase [Bacteroidetes bacterium]|jgi:pyruvate-ferredoxin/flavodoxin oxidoreductase|nr:pyruvate:ferredoxin (flavodoxin) oxidoreductase [Bacteroidota bacterium]MBT6687292.1 pyruvate:ferredoxin (flavodoxin) oxidoreductase [Bacteroidota bacterium]MBT7143956.1 pyruvate:ferredoxin (flavodoxin) oxidoreductase [Bacteroidota bacterium]MBT7491131.1 pyruvate:ferredoxin (flavodoxin) oxidoreductase [Bacteroidota bacterium]